MVKIAAPVRRFLSFVLTILTYCKKFDIHKTVSLESCQQITLLIGVQYHRVWRTSNLRILTIIDWYDEQKSECGAGWDKTIDVSGNKMQGYIP
ncbi:hypothetical protein IGI04_015037 [Brassica rapa subsp. trilocularis]|uniref:Uncharacterized protein n=1 Tax=Brassica rapa subsp. trilocularis TaxID=1813537 RepID=A0ABQ7MPI5_BRACM|nr:hypothetical protein IGI04_015037 [Brassica rapa subsp. trilocularis]